MKNVHDDHEFCDARLGCVPMYDMSGLTGAQAAYYRELLKMVAPQEKRFRRIIHAAIDRAREANRANEQL